MLRSIYKASYEREAYVMTYRQVEASREARLWIGQIIVPAITLAVTTLAIPEVRQAISMKAESIKCSIEMKMKKKGP